ncbi:MAG TPA: LysR family transcriptional regulator [Blastocatellia bacterium]|nr:LysR family transcriptional regulator [Blastocatellia bacterium]
MELRHLRYFVAVAEEGSLTLAAERRLHTAQPSLSRQIRDLEHEVGVPLLRRTPHGVELTDAGSVFLEYARQALAQADSAREAARRAGKAAKGSLAIGFLTGQEMNWLPEVMRIVRDTLPDVDIAVTSMISPALAEEVSRGKLDLAFMRAESSPPHLEYRVVRREPIVVVLPSDHHLAAQPAIRPQALVGETFIGTGPVAPVLRGIVDDYLRRSGVAITPDHDVDNLAMAISLIASTGGVGLAPAYMEKLLPATLVARPLQGEVPTIDLVVGYLKTNRSSSLAVFLSNLGTLIERVAQG